MGVDAASGFASLWWWIAIAVLFLVVIPLVLFLAHRLLRVIMEISRYAGDIQDHGVGITANLAPVPALLDTRDLVKRVGGGLTDYVESVDRML